MSLLVGSHHLITGLQVTPRNEADEDSQYFHEARPYPGGEPGTTATDYAFRDPIVFEHMVKNKLSTFKTSGKAGQGNMA